MNMKDLQFYIGLTLCVLGVASFFFLPSVLSMILAEKIVQENAIVVSCDEDYYYSFIVGKFFESSSRQRYKTDITVRLDNGEVVEFTEIASYGQKGNYTTGKEVNVYSYNGKYQAKRDSLFKNALTKCISIGMVVVGFLISGKKFLR